MLAIMRAESGCDPSSDNTGLNKNGTVDKGLLQINDIHVTSGLIADTDRLIPELNIQAAYDIWLGGGYAAWSSYNSGDYLRFM